MDRIDMADLIEEMENAVALYIRGRALEAVEAGRALLDRARGTPHAARVYRYMAEFLHATGNYQRARDIAREASSLARATRHTDEVLASSLMLLACDLYEGHLAKVHEQLKELTEMAPDQPMPMVFMAQVMLVVGELDYAIGLLDRASGLLNELATAGAKPSIDLFRTNVLLSKGKTFLLAKKPQEAIDVLECSMDLDVPTPVPGTLAQAMLALAWSQSGQIDRGSHMMDQALEQGRAISQDIHGHVLSFSGLQSMQAGKLELAVERFDKSVNLLAHPLERQESYCALGDIHLSLGMKDKAETAYRHATEPTMESLFGRTAVSALRKLLGFRLV